MPRCLLAAVVAVCLCADVVAQTVRFETSVGDFDMVLNPTGDANLQPLVDNMVAYIGLGRYHFSAINRAVDNDNDDPADDFVLQMGGFLGFPPSPDQWAQLVQPVESLSPVVVDSDGDGQVDFNARTNSRGTVSLALSAGDVNSGTSSFFVNLGNNDFLDADGFVPFAEIEQMDTIDRIMGLMQRDLSDELGQPGNLGFVDVPLTDEERIVVVDRVRVIEADDDFSFVGPIATALQLAMRDADPLTAPSETILSSMASESMSAPPVLPVTSTTVPEPAAAALALPVAVWLAVRRRWRATC